MDQPESFTSSAPLIFIIAGEDSGDLHGARLIEELRQENPHFLFAGYGGQKMAAAGCEILVPVDKLAIMGFVEVIKHLSFFRRLLNDTVNEILRRRPQRVILIDYPGFNLRLAKRLAEYRIPCTYFILPQVWAWKEKRVKIIRRYFDQTLSIFPFEEAWFNQRKVNTTYVGHPFSELPAPEQTRTDFYHHHRLAKNTPLLVLFPGSRQQEVDRHLAVFLSAAQQLAHANPGLRIMVGRAPGINIEPLPAGILVEDRNPLMALRYGQAAVVASGTATLEAAVFNIPAVVGYRLAPVTFWLARRLVKTPYVAMSNLIAGKLVVPELLQNDLTAENLVFQLQPLLSQSDERTRMLTDYAEIRRALGEPGAYRRAAHLISEQITAMTDEAE